MLINKNNNLLRKDVNSDEKTMLVLLMTLKDICPYNYEAIELLLNKLHEIVSSAETGHDSTEFDRVKDACVLLNFLRYVFQLSLIKH